MAAPTVAGKVELTREAQQQDARDAAKELADILEAEAHEVLRTGQLNLSKELMLHILQLFSQRECITDKERQLIREMVSDISNDLRDSKKAQAGIHLTFALVGGACGVVGGVQQAEALSAVGNMLHGFGGASDPFFAANQVWMEVGKQLLMNDEGQGSSLAEKIHKGLDRAIEAQGQLESTRVQASRTR